MNKREAPSSMWLLRAHPPRGAPQRRAPSLGSPQPGRPRLGEAMEQAVEWRPHRPLRTRRWWKAVGRPGRGWGRATERGRGGGRRQRRGTHRGEAPALPTGGSPAPGEPAASSILVDGGGERRLGPSTVAPVPQGPSDADAGIRGRPPGRMAEPSWGFAGTSFPAPRGLVLNWSQVPTAVPTKWRTSSPPAAMTGGGGTIPHGGEARVEALPLPAARSRTHFTRCPDLPLSIAPARARARPSRGASGTGQGGRWGHRGRVSPRAGSLGAAAAAWAPRPEPGQAATASDSRAVPGPGGHPGRPGPEPVAGAAGGETRAA